MITGPDYDAALRAAGYTPSDVLWNGTSHVYACDGLAVRVSRATADDALTALTLVGADMGRAPNLPVVYDVAVRHGLLVVAMELLGPVPGGFDVDLNDLERQAASIGLPAWTVADVHAANVGLRLDGVGRTPVLFDVWRRPAARRRDDG